MPNADQRRSKFFPFCEPQTKTQVLVNICMQWFLPMGRNAILSRLYAFGTEKSLTAWLEMNLFRYLLTTVMNTTNTLLQKIMFRIYLQLTGFN